MNKIITALCLIFASSVFIFAQDDYKKNEFYVGYSNQQVDNKRGSEDDIRGAFLNTSDNDINDFLRDRKSFNGFEAAYTRNVSRYFGIKGSISGAYRNNQPFVGSRIVTPTFNISGRVDRSIYNYMVGVQVKDNLTEKRFKPFAHALFGINDKRTKIKEVLCTINSCPQNILNNTSKRGLAGEFGGGLDIKINDKIDFRAIQVDYNPVFYKNGGNNVRFGVGIVLH